MTAFLLDRFAVVLADAREAAQRGDFWRARLLLSAALSILSQMEAAARQRGRHSR